MTFPTRKLGELGEFRNGLNYSKENFGTGLKVISVKHFGDRWRPDLTILDEISPAGMRIANSNLQRGDIVFVRSNGNKELIGRSMLIEDDLEDVSYSGFCIRFRPSDTSTNSRFLSLFFRTSLFRRVLSQQGKGTNINNLNQSILERMEVPYPQPIVQGRITEVASAYDDLIETNRRRIALLEEAARLLYREWFVHFRFPGHEHVPLTDGLPEGWERFALSDLAEFINGYAFKPAHLGDDGLPIVKIPELKQGVTDKTPRNDGEMIPEKYHLKDGDLLFSWSGTLAVNVWASGPALLNQHLFHVVPRGRVSRGFLMCAIREALIAFENQTVGATMKHIRRSALDRVFVSLPDRAFMSPVEDTLTNTYDQLIVLHQQNQKLAQARDLLLPRLMNGEIAV